jgi:CheY-like chemotaxis protein/HPt (histidine-containing phosphotransfer) domain-containing protein
LGRAAAAGTPFPLVLLDAVMPGVDGFAVAEQIRRRPELARATVMLLSSGDRHRDLDRCRELGLARHLTKPVKPSDLLDAILAALARPGAGGPPAGPPPPPAEAAPAPAAAPLRVLLVEDNAVNQMLAVKALARQGHAVTVAGSGRDALERLGIPPFGPPAAGGPPFDLVLMDVQMPEMDGIEATAAIRAHERGTGRRVPIIALTAHALKGDREQCLAAGMDGYLCKPIQAAELRRAVAALAPLVGAGSGDRTTTMAPGPAAAPTAAVIDRDAILDRVDRDEELLRAVVAEFLNGCPRQVAAVRAAIDGADAPALFRAAHALKGPLGVFGAKAAVEAVLRLEELGRTGHLAPAAGAYDELERSLEQVKPALAALAAGTVTNP